MAVLSAQLNYSLPTLLRHARSKLMNQSSSLQAFRRVSAPQLARTLTTNFSEDGDLRIDFLKKKHALSTKLEDINVNVVDDAYDNIIKNNLKKLVSSMKEDYSEMLYAYKNSYELALAYNSLLKSAHFLGMNCMRLMSFAVRELRSSYGQDSTVDYENYRKIVFSEQWIRLSYELEQIEYISSLVAKLPEEKKSYYSGLFEDLLQSVNHKQSLLENIELQYMYLEDMNKMQSKIFNRINRYDGSKKFDEETANNLFQQIIEKLN